VSGSQPIPDEYMTASSVYGPDWEAHYARLGGAPSWCASITERDAPTPSFYIQVDCTAWQNIGCRMNVFEM